MSRQYGDYQMEIYLDGLRGSSGSRSVIAIQR